MFSQEQCYYQFKAQTKVSSMTASQYSFPRPVYDTILIVLILVFYVVRMQALRKQQTWEDQKQRLRVAGMFPERLPQL